MTNAPTAEESATDGTPDEVTRRRMFGWLRGAAVAGAGAVVVSSLLDSSPAHADIMTTAALGDGHAMQVGGNNVNTSNATTLIGSASNTFMLKVTNQSGTGSPIALSGEQTSSSPATGAGVAGVATGSQAAGVIGTAFGTNGYGLRGVSATGSALLLSESTGDMPPAGGVWVTGSFVVRSGHVWYCYAGGIGSDSKWVKLSSTLVTLGSPARVYDSRTADTALASGQERAVTVVGTYGAATIPSGISAVLTNLTCAGPTGSGYLAMFRDGTTWSGTSNVNFGGANIANNATSAVSAGGNVRVLCGGGGSTHFIVDVFGYYL